MLSGTRKYVYYNFKDKMFVKKAEYEEEVRRDDVNFWRTSNDEVPSHYNRKESPPNRPNQSGVMGNNSMRNPNTYNAPAENEPGELAGDSSFQPLKRDNVYNLWLNNPQEMDFFKNGRKQQPSPGRNEPSNNNSTINKSSAVRIKKTSGPPGGGR